MSNYKDLEDMNLVDNFLFGTAVSNEEYGPLIAGTILETIFHRKIKIKNVQSEKVVWPSNPELHGIRLHIVAGALYGSRNGGPVHYSIGDGP